MKTRSLQHRITWAAGSAVPAVLALFSPKVASAQQQVDVNPPLPNVLILLDNSGSMERMIDGTLPESTPANTCNCDPVSGACNWTQPPQANRWNIVQQALTGTLQNGFNCVAMPRTPGSNFTSEYQIAQNPPYDTNYYLPFHRMVAQDNSSGTGVACVVAPGALPGATTPGGVGPSGLGAGGNATDFAGGIITRPYLPLNATPNSCQFTQLSNGALSTMTDLMRFGLMTFDQDPSPAVGINAPALTVTNPAFTGMWSYFPNWNTGPLPSPYNGLPAGCTSTQLTAMAVGARNPAAPPWEGRMVGFPSTNAITDQETNNGQISSVVLASRPYGATPMAGMLTGAQFYFQGDKTGPQATDPYVQGGCRNEYVIMLTDGTPNDDMRPSCENSDAGLGQCPFSKPTDIVAALYNNGLRVGPQQFVTTYVIGFAVSTFQDQGVTANCSNFAVASGGQISNECVNAAPTTPLGACCELQQIAFSGGSKSAFFADTPGDLQKALGSILADIAKQATTRTTPAYSPVLSGSVANVNAPQTSASSFLASFDPSPGLPWSGDVQRQRFDCTFAASTSTFTVPAPVVTPSLGDDFAQNLNTGSSARTFIALQPDAFNGGPTADSTQTIRPFVSATVGDGVPLYNATVHADSATNVIAAITPDALGIPLTGLHPGCQYTPNNAPGPAYLTPAQCRNMLLDFTFAQPSFSGPSDFTFVSRSATTSPNASAFGDVFHASPVVVGPPGSLLQDPSYDQFRATWNSVPATSGRGSANGQTTKPRDTIVYTATNDGLLHAFWADENKLENNEEWAFIPPAVMPNLQSSYPSSHQFLLDGTPIVKDVVWERFNGNAIPSNMTNPWHTMLVAGFGPYQRGYYAVDVTNPDAAGLLSGGSTLTPPGPQFRWQLTKMPATNYPIFGAQSAIPAITTLFMDPGDGAGAREIGVAILPGGVDAGGPKSSLGNGPSCPRLPKTSDSAPVSGYAARDAVRCWGPNQKSTDVVNGRSVSIVRLDTGEILRVFARKADVLTFPNDTLNLKGRYIDTLLDSPMTGTPVVYPSDVGTAATKAFVGDADGTIWRFDLSSSNPASWVGELYLDLYNKQVDTSATSWADGQPFQVPMVASLDTSGELVLDAASGSTETFDTTGINYLYSITERIQGTPAKPRAFINWYFGPGTSTLVSFLPGERVSGPMTVFNGTLYFATYAAASAATQSCSSGAARLWGWDFVQPHDSSCTSDPAASCKRGDGGVRELQPPTPAPDFVDPVVTNGAPQGAVIPGVSIQATPACGALPQSGTSNPYISGASHSAPSSLSQGSYALVAQVGAKGGSSSGGAATQQLQTPLATPTTPTVIDSWAAVLE